MQQHRVLEYPGAALVLLSLLATGVASAGRDMDADSPVKFPEEGALPARHPPDRHSTEREIPEEGYYIFGTPERSLSQIAAIQSEMPRGEFTAPPNDWTHLPRTRTALTKGGTLRILAMGDSIVNDTMRSAWVAKLQETYPEAKIRATVYVRGGGGCQHYKEEGRVARHVVPRKPDLVLIGGISQRDIESIREAIRQLRKDLPDVEILLLTGAFGRADPRDAVALARASYSGSGEYGRQLEALAAAERCAYVDMTTPWAEYICSSGQHPHRFYRDRVHANEYGEQILSKILMAFWHPAAAPGGTERPAWDEAEHNGELARECLVRCRDYVRGWLAHADPVTGLIPRNLNRNRDFWNGRDAAADNYAFMVLTSSLTDEPMFEGRMRDMLRAEIRLTSRVDNLVDDYSFTKQGFRNDKADLGHMTFDSSEYVKDGLLPLTEWLGPTPWSERMLGLVDSILDHASADTPFGRLPATDHEVGGEMMQVLSRLYWMTGEERYRETAFRYADYFLLHKLPTREQRLSLDDHGCEVIGGLSEVYYLAAKTDVERHRRYRAPVHEMLDRILEVGRNENGLFHMRIDPIEGEVLVEELTDNWGYDYNAYLTVAELDNHTPYREAVRFALKNVHKHTGYPWEGDIADGYADSIESGLNLLNRIPTESGFQWVEHETRHMLKKQRDDGVIEGWHGDGNYARTAIMVALWKTRGCQARPWRADVSLGAVERAGTLHVSIRSRWPWKGRIVFDRPRHREYFRIPTDYARLNQFPEWFTVESDATYEVTEAKGKGESTRTLTGALLRDGLPVALGAEEALRLTVRPIAGRRPI